MTEALPAPQTAAPVAEAPAQTMGLTQIRGINEKRAVQLRANGINSVEDLAKASASDLATKLEVSPKIVKMWIGSAKKLVNKRELLRTNRRFYISRTIFLFSKRLRASKNSFLFSPAKFRLCIMSLTDISDLPKFSCRLWRCLTIDLSSFPHRQVVFLIRITIVLTNVWSRVCRLDKTPLPPS